MLAVLSVIAVFVALILVHEWGHFIAAKKSGMKVEEFGIFFPPRLFSWKKGETVYSINLIPLGGFVKILGEEGGHQDNPRSFSAQSISKRTLALSAGVIMNVILAAVFFIWAFNVGMPTAVTPENQDSLQDISTRVVQVAPGSPAQEAGFKVGDRLLSINDQTFNSIDDLQAFVSDRSGQELRVEVRRGDTLKTLGVLARSDPPEGEGAMGVSLARVGLDKQGFFASIKSGIVSTVNTIGGVVYGFYMLLKGLLTGAEVGGQVAGPAGIFALFFQFYELGIPFFLRFAGLLSISLAIINILPIPALDGGRIAFLGWEAITGRKASQRIEQVAHTVGFILLILLIVIITIQDIARF